MAVEFRPVRCSIDPETGLFWVDDSLNYPRLMCEARTTPGRPSARADAPEYVAFRLESLW
jgi:hypothetical protein